MTRVPVAVYAPVPYRSRYDLSLAGEVAGGGKLVNPQPTPPFPMKGGRKEG
jgi:hypothetical protein